MKIFSIIVIGLCFMFVSVDAQNRGQTRTFEWTDIMCGYKGTYDSRKYSEVQLRNTWRLIDHDGPSLEGMATVWQYDEIAGLDVAALDRSYNGVRSEIENLNIVKTPYWQNVRKKKLEALEQDYRLRRTTMLAYTKPAVLMEYPAAEACKLKYAGPIAKGGDALLGLWREVNLESQVNNADPARLQRIFDEQRRSPDRLKFALVETMAFGWWNCANDVLRDGPAFNPEDSEHAEEFKKLFTRLTEDCEEP
jgi:hypothetical protein